MSTRSLTLAEAGRRATEVEAPSYDVHLDLTDPATGTFASRSTVRFTPRAESTFLELADADQVARFERALRGDVPTLLRRAWEDELDDRR